MGPAKRRASTSPSRNPSTSKKKLKSTRSEEPSKDGFKLEHLRNTYASWLDVLFVSRLGSDSVRVARRDLIVLNVFAVSPKVAKIAGGDLFCLSPIMEFLQAAWNIPTGSAVVRLRSMAPTHRRHLIDVTQMEASRLKEIPAGIIKLGEGLGVLFERFTQPPSKVAVSVEASPWHSEGDVGDALEGLSFVESAENVKQFRLKNGNPTARFTVHLTIEESAMIEPMEGDGNITSPGVIAIKIDDVIKGDDVPARLLAESRSFFVTVRSERNSSVMVLRRIPECSFCSSNEHLNEDCQTRLYLLSKDIGVTKVSGWNTPVIEV